MNDFDRYRKVAIDGIAMLRKLADKKKEIEIQSRKLTHLVLASINMLPESEETSKFREDLSAIDEPAGLRNAVMKTLRTKTYMSVPELRFQLNRNGYDTTGHVNPLASIHTTLKRLMNDGEVESTKINNKLRYRRKSKSLTVEIKD